MRRPQLSSLLAIGALVVAVGLAAGQTRTKCIELQVEEGESKQYPKDAAIVERINCEAAIHFDRLLAADADLATVCEDACDEKMYRLGVQFDTNYEGKVACCCSDHV